MNKTYLPTSGDDGHVARWVADLEQHLLRMWSQFLHQRSIAILIQYALARRDRVLPAKNIAIVSSRPDWPLWSLMPKGGLRVRKFKKPLIERNAALKKGQGLTLNEPENRLKKTLNELVKKLKKKDYASRKRLECV